MHLLVGVVAALAVTFPNAQATREEPAEVRCPAVLGVGLSTDQTFCDVLTGRDPGVGILVAIPPHRGTATLSLDLFNRHTYSEEQVRSGRGYAQYTATIHVVTMDNELLARGVVRSEFRSADDLIDRVAGGAGPGGVKAVAPTGREQIAVTIAPEITEVSILGEQLEVVGMNGRDTFTSPGRPIAIISNVTIEYRSR